MAYGFSSLNVSRSNKKAYLNFHERNVSLIYISDLSRFASTEYFTWHFLNQKCVLLWLYLVVYYSYSIRKSLLFNNTTIVFLKN